MDPWIHGSAAGAAASAAVCIYDVAIGRALRAPLYIHDKIHTTAWKTFKGLTVFHT